MKVSVDVESFKRSQEDHGGWNHLMNQVRTCLKGSVEEMCISLEVILVSYCSI